MPCACAARRWTKRRIAAAGKEAVRAIVPRQIEAGIDVINNGEQQRESFVLYLRHRLSGIGGSGARQVPADIDAYPAFKRARQAAGRRRFSVSNLDHVPEGDRRRPLSRSGAGRGRMRRLRRRAGAEPRPLRGGVPHRALAGDRRRRRATTSTTTACECLSRRARRGASGRVRGDRRATASCCSSIARTWRWSGTSPIAIGRSSDFLAFVEMVVAAINAALRNVPRDRVRLHVCWGNYEGPHDRDVPLEAVFPIIRQAEVGGFVLPFANPRHAHEYRCLKGMPLADDQILVAGVIDTLTNFVEHPRGRRRSPRARRRAPSAIPAACWPAPIAASTPPPATAGSPRTWSGASSRRCVTAPGSPRSGCSAIEALMQGARLTDGQSAFRLVGQSFPIVLRSLAHAQPGGSRAWGRALRAIGWAARTDQSDQELVVCATHGFRTGHHA